MYGHPLDPRRKGAGKDYALIIITWTRRATVAAFAFVVWFNLMTYFNN